MSNNNRRRAKHWAITINNYVGEIVNLWCAQKMEYLIIGEEGSSTPTPHLQIYCCFKIKKRFSQVKKSFPRAHLEICFGTPEENIEYCSKEGKFTSFGTVPLTAKQALKRKWTEIYTLAKSGKYEDMPKDVLIRHYGNIKKIRADHKDKIEDLLVLNNVWIYGTSGVGKSTYARQTWPDNFNKPATKWWDRYEGEACVILDDLSIDDCYKLKKLLKVWADLFPFVGEVKGDSLWIRPTRIVVTSQYTIKECFANDDKQCQAITRRFKQVHLLHWQVRDIFQCLEDI